MLSINGLLYSYELIHIQINVNLENWLWRSKLSVGQLSWCERRLNTFSYLLEFYFIKRTLFFSLLCCEPIPKSNEKYKIRLRNYKTDQRYESSTVSIYAVRLKYWTIMLCYFLLLLFCRWGVLRLLL